MLIANRAGIGAVVYLSLGVPCDAPCIHMNRHPFQAVDILQVFHGDILQTVGYLLAESVDIPGILTVVQSSIVGAADAPGTVIPCDHRRRLTFPDLPCLLVAPHKSADLSGTGHAAEGTAVFNLSIVDPRQKPHSVSAALRVHHA